MHFVFYIDDRWSVEKLTGSMYSLWTLSSTFSIDGRSWSWRACVSGLRSSWGFCWRSWAPMLAILMRSRLCCQSWGAPGAHAGGRGLLLGLCWRSWATPGAYVGGLGPLLGPILAVLGWSWASTAVLSRSWDLSWRSCAALEGCVGGLWPRCRRSWAAVGASVGKYEEHSFFEYVLISQAGARSSAKGAALGLSWTFCWQS